jgi:hypothetical protein
MKRSGAVGADLTPGILVTILKVMVPNSVNVSNDS